MAEIFSSTQRGEGRVRGMEGRHGKKKKEPLEIDFRVVFFTQKLAGRGPARKIARVRSLGAIFLDTKILYVKMPELPRLYGEREGQALRE